MEIFFIIVFFLWLTIAVCRSVAIIHEVKKEKDQC